jgi:hypothetical protein
MRSYAQEGFLCLARLEAVCSRNIVGWAMAEHPETSLVGRGWQMALLATVTGRAKRRLSNLSLIDNLSFA